MELEDLKSLYAEVENALGAIEDINVLPELDKAINQGIQEANKQLSIVLDLLDTLVAEAEADDEDPEE